MTVFSWSSRSRNASRKLAEPVVGHGHLGGVDGVEAPQLLRGEVARSSRSGSRRSPVPCSRGPRTCRCTCSAGSTARADRRSRPSCRRAGAGRRRPARRSPSCRRGRRRSAPRPRRRRCWPGTRACPSCSACRAAPAGASGPPSRGRPISGGFRSVDWPTIPSQRSNVSRNGSYTLVKARKGLSLICAVQ